MDQLRLLSTFFSTLDRIISHHPPLVLADNNRKLIIFRVSDLDRAIAASLQTNQGVAGPPVGDEDAQMQQIMLASIQSNQGNPAAFKHSFTAEQR